MTGKESTWPSNEEFLRAFDKRSAELRIPLTGSLELTSRCNLNCIHCYLGPHQGPERTNLPELTTSRMLSVIDEITDAGCLNLLLTGGEPLLRKDFKELYSHAKKNGMLITIFTNGTTVTADVVSLLADLPPQAVEISLYGATEETYEKITSVPGSYRKCMQGLHLLLEAGIRVDLKTMLMTLNSHELFRMENMAKELGLKFRFDAALFPKFNGDRSPVSLRVPPEEVVDKEFSDAERYAQWRDYYHHVKSLPASDKLYVCGAGMNSFHIDAHGSLKPCLMSRSLQYSLEKGDFATGWRDVIALIREKKAGKDYKCNGCEKGLLCGYCPALFGLENGKEDLCSAYTCETGKERFNRII